MQAPLISRRYSLRWWFYVPRLFVSAVLGATLFVILSSSWPTASIVELLMNLLLGLVCLSGLAAVWLGVPDHIIIGPESVRARYAFGLLQLSCPTMSLTVRHVEQRLPESLVGSSVALLMADRRSWQRALGGIRFVPEAYTDSSDLKAFVYSLPSEEHAGA